MTVAKSQIKMLVAQEIGSKLDDALEAEHHECSKDEGRHHAASQIAGACVEVIKLVDTDLDDDENTNVPDIPTAKVIKGYLNRVLAQAMTIAKQAKMSEQEHKGGIKAMEKAVLVAKKVFDGEAAKIEQVIALEDDEFVGDAPDPGRDPGGQENGEERPGGRPTGVRPGMSIADQRRAEDAAEAKKKEEAEQKTNGKDHDPPPPPEDAPKEEAKSEPKAKKVSKKRRRKKKVSSKSKGEAAGTDANKAAVKKLRGRRSGANT